MTTNINQDVTNPHNETGLPESVKPIKEEDLSAVIALAQGFFNDAARHGNLRSDVFLAYANAPEGRTITGPDGITVKYDENVAAQHAMLHMNVITLQRVADFLEGKNSNDSLLKSYSDRVELTAEILGDSPLEPDYDSARHYFSGVTQFLAA